MQNGDEALPSIILAGRFLLVKMLITLKPQHTFRSNFAYLYVIFKLAENDKEMKKISLTWIQTTVHQAVGLQEKLDHSATTYCIYTRAIYINLLYLCSSD